SIIPIIGSGILGKIFNITFASILFSQILSNVPFAKFYVEYLKATSFSTPTQIEWITLAMASTIAGNLTLLGAASNIIIIEYLESYYNTTISFKEFFKYGLITTALNTIIYIIYIIFTL
ncbi:MAG: anion transporter, partial [Nitrososphaeria archaeon]